MQIYCGKLPKDVLEEDLIPLFEKCGTIWDMRVMMDPVTGLNRGFCFVTFTDKRAAEEAVKQVFLLCINCIRVAVQCFFRVVCGGVTHPC